MTKTFVALSTLALIVAACSGDGVGPGTPVASISVLPTAATVAVGDTLPLAATLSDASGNVLTGRTITWSSSDSLVASISSVTGFVVGVSGGTATITATSEGQTGTASLTVQTLMSMVSAGRFHTCALTTSAIAVCWGSGEDGQLGDGSSGVGVLSTSPAVVAGGITFASVDAGGRHTCGITGTGSAFCWGRNGSGELGDGTGTDAVAPTAVAGGLTFSSLSTGRDHTCAVNTAGSAFCWGRNGDGQLGDNSGVDRQTPVVVVGGQSFVSVSAGRRHTCGVEQTTGAAFCWGRGDVGQLGDNLVASTLQPVAVAGGLSFSAVHAGDAHTCGLESVTGTAYCWGDNGDGQIGNGTTTPVAVPTAVAGGLTFSSLTARGDHACAVTSTGVAYCWGRGDFGQLGNAASGIGVFSNTPVAVAGAIEFASVAAGSDHTCGVSATGETYCWGQGTFGRLGNGATILHSSPTRVSEPLY